MKKGNKGKYSIFTRWKHTEIIMSVSWNLHDISKVTAKIIPWGQIKSANSFHNVCKNKNAIIFCFEIKKPPDISDEDLRTWRREKGGRGNIIEW